MLDLTENVNEKVTFDQLKPELNISVNRPFFFIVEMDHDVLALGRIKDPNWCKFCNRAATNASVNATATSTGVLISATSTTPWRPTPLVAATATAITTEAPGFFSRLFG